jgi:hypothetical protein
MTGQFLHAAAQLLAAQGVRKFQLEWCWRRASGITFFKTIWHGRDANHARERFLSATPQAINVRVIGEVRG